MHLLLICCLFFLSFCSSALISDYVHWTVCPCLKTSFRNFKYTLGHHQCIANLPEDVSEEIDKFKSAVR